MRAFIRGVAIALNSALVIGMGYMILSRLRIVLIAAVDV
jgi:hypothetical protein